MTILITGAAGCGKTFLINRLKGLHPDWSYTAMTQEAASLIDGRTLHSRMRMTGVAWFDEMTKPSYRKATILIDEASMLSQEMFDFMVKARPNFDFILVGDFHQLMPVVGSPITKGIDKIIRLTHNYRATEEALQIFLNNILNNSIDWSVIENHKAKNRPDNKTLLITFFNKSKQDWTQNLKLTKGSPVKGHHTRYVRGEKHNYRDDKRFFDTDSKRTKSPAWYNNELFTITKMSSFDVVLWNERDGAMSLPIDIFHDYFEPFFATTFYGVQGQTRTSRTIVDLSTITSKKIDADRRIRSLYVACSRVTKLADLEFCYDDLNTIKNAGYRFTDTLNAVQDDLMSQSEVVEFFDSDWLCISKSSGKTIEMMASRSDVQDSTSGDTGLVDSIRKLQEGRLTDAKRKEIKQLGIEVLRKSDVNLPLTEIAKVLHMSYKTIKRWNKEI